jgi:DNA helicase HerA-like ATPase
VSRILTGKTQPPSDPTRLGTVEDVSGPSVRIKLSDETATGLVFVRGEGYRVGQVGSFVRIPAGYLDLFGVVSQVGAGAAPGPPETTPVFGNRWIRAELVGEGGRGRAFRRGISQYPSIGDAAHVVTESDLAAIYAPGDERTYVSIGRVASAESIPAYLDLNKLVARHSAVVGSTGAGKSTTVAALLDSLGDPKSFPSARIVLLDLHGEYAEAFGSRARVFRVDARVDRGERPLFVPYWALSLEEFVELSLGKLDEKQMAVIGDLVLALKEEGLMANPSIQLGASPLTVDTPVPFRVRELWFRQYRREFRMVTKKQGGSEDETVDALVLRGDGSFEESGDAEGLVPPKYRTFKSTGPRDTHVSAANEGTNLRLQLASLHSKLKGSRFGFLFSPGKWAPDAAGRVATDLDELLESWLGNDAPITVIDLSGMPSVVTDTVVGAVLRIVYDGLFWGRLLDAGGRHRPLLLVLEEAHNYLAKDGAGRAQAVVRRIAKEGRKYGVGLMLVSQRPSEIDPTILAQCGTLLAMRLTNESDRGQVRSCASDNLEGLLAMLPILRTGEALVVGEAVGLPMRALIERPPIGRRPNSDDPEVVVRLTSDGTPEHSGGWTDAVAKEDYSWLVRCWRAQNTFASKGLDGGQAESSATKA